MATAQELQAKLQNKLRELFQLNEPDLDFGFYRVMHAKAKEVNAFLVERLPQEIKAAFASSGGAQRRQAFDAAKAALVDGLGPDAIAADGSVAASYASVPLAKAYETARAALAGASSGGEAEADVYDHLYHFFERYYDKGDFVSLRYLKRETDHAAAAYATPYGGEEVKLHWANADQYYIKTGENFSHFAFDAVRHPEIAKLDEMARMAANVPTSCKVRFEIVEADEGDHGNIKQGKDRFFILHAAKPCETKDGTTVVSFEYREDPEQSGPSAKWQEKRRAEALDALKGKVPDLLFFDVNGGDKKKGARPLLDVYLKRYFARNTADYFIHKDLGGFLRRELDFYIKNEMIALDDVAAAQAETVAKWLGKVQVFRRIANEIIDFLAQLEDFQKKLWLKRKFVVQCDYCLTMDRVPEELRAEVFANAAQRAEWERLGFDCSERPAVVQGELAGVGTAPRADRIDARMVDTKFFDEAFKQRLLASVDDFDEQCDGVLIHGENFGAMRLLDGYYRGRVKSVFIDPPYNTGDDGFPYKDKYRSSSWMSMLTDRIRLSYPLLSENGLFACHIDEHEHKTLEYILDSVFADGNFGPMIWDKRNPKGDVLGLAAQHEYVHYAAKSRQHLIGVEDAFVRDKANAEAMLKKAAVLVKKAKGVTDGVHKEFAEWLKNQPFSNGEKAYKFIDDNGDLFQSVSMAAPDKPETRCHIPLIHPVTGKPCGVPAKGWRNTWERMQELQSLDLIIFGPDEMTQPRRKYLLKENLTEMVPSVYYFGGSDDALFAGLGLAFDNPKTVRGSCYFLKPMARPFDSTVLDYFAGSGTTAHAVIDLNRQDGGKRKYILIEMGDHFDTVLKPRIEKVVYSPDWKDGKPTAPARGISHCFKYLRLESYEDALNNLEVDGAKGVAFAGISDYFLKYMLQVETAGSASLLNVESFRDPFGYRLVVKKPASEEREVRTVDLVETFNYLIGLRVKHTSETRAYAAAFERKADPELPEDAHTKLTLAGRLRLAADGAWKFRTVEGWCPKNRFTPNDGAKERVLVVWRTLTGDLEKDNAVLNAFLEREAVNALDGEYDVIYVNGSNNVPNLRKESDTWKVRLIEEDFRARMWEGA